MKLPYYLEQGSLIAYLQIHSSFSLSYSEWPFTQLKDTDSCASVFWKHVRQLPRFSLKRERTSFCLFFHCYSKGRHDDSNSNCHLGWYTTLLKNFVLFLIINIANIYYLCSENSDTLLIINCVSYYSWPYKLGSVIIFIYTVGKPRVGKVKWFEKVH